MAPKKSNKSQLAPAVKIEKSLAGTILRGNTLKERLLQRKQGKTIDDAPNSSLWELETVDKDVNRSKKQSVGTDKTLDPTESRFWDLPPTQEDVANAPKTSVRKEKVIKKEKILPKGKPISKEKTPSKPKPSDKRPKPVSSRRRDDSEDEYRPHKKKKFTNTKKSDSRPPITRKTKSQPKIDVANVIDLISPSPPAQNKDELEGKTLVDGISTGEEDDKVDNKDLEELAGATIYYLSEEGIPVQLDHDYEPVLKMSQSGVLKAFAVPMDEPPRKYASPSITEATSKPDEEPDVPVLVAEDDQPPEALEYTNEDYELEDDVFGNESTEVIYSDSQEPKNGTTEEPIEITSSAEERPIPKGVNDPSQEIPTASFEPVDSPTSVVATQGSAALVESFNEIKETLAPAQDIIDLTQSPIADVVNTESRDEAGNINKKAEQEHRVSPAPEETFIGVSKPPFRRPAPRLLRFSDIPNRKQRKPDLEIGDNLFAEHSRVEFKNRSRYTGQFRSLEGKASPPRSFMERLRTDTTYNSPPGGWRSDSDGEKSTPIIEPSLVDKIKRISPRTKDTPDETPEATPTFSEIQKLLQLPDQSKKTTELINRMEELVKTTAKFAPRQKRNTDEPNQQRKAKIEIDKTLTRQNIQPKKQVRFLKESQLPEFLGKRGLQAQTVDPLLSDSEQEDASSPPQRNKFPEDTIVVRTERNNVKATTQHGGLARSLDMSNLTLTRQLERDHLLQEQEMEKQFESIITEITRKKDDAIRELKATFDTINQSAFENAKESIDHCSEELKSPKTHKYDNHRKQYTEINSEQFPEVKQALLRQQEMISQLETIIGKRKREVAKMHAVDAEMNRYYKTCMELAEELKDEELHYDFLYGVAIHGEEYMKKNFQVPDNYEPPKNTTGIIPQFEHIKRSITEMVRKDPNFTEQSEQVYEDMMESAVDRIWEEEGFDRDSESEIKGSSKDSYLRSVSGTKRAGSRGVDRSQGMEWRGQQNSRKYSES
ncbi:hypothetical protein H072_10550 [Dactylellina haptotyla CBS 200.50]|uniref:Uncharacterized protein n=1 Tax=Dactylellina haptotyla (strain CBS 200.50) TaxID=1284197 RepID=S7ZZ09_DACHA|nr:hypothetical protein H072_10550 [Dactylellina haptotyla CBS 200.50]